jgi:hypothetical protein
MTDTMSEGTYPLGTALTSANGSFRLAFQADGNLVLSYGDRPFWSSKTNEGTEPGVQLILRNGVLSIRSLNGSICEYGKGGSPGAILVVQNDGNLVIYDANHSTVWQSNTSATAAPGANV